MLPYLGVISRENMQIEGFWYYLFLGVFEAATIHYAVAKIFDPLLFGRGWCGYACWTAMVLDFLPYQQPQKPRKENWASSATSAQRPAPQRRCVNGSCRTHHAISVKGTGGLKAKSEPSRSRFILLPLLTRRIFCCFRSAFPAPILFCVKDDFAIVQTRSP